MRERVHQRLDAEAQPQSDIKKEQTVKTNGDVCEPDISKKSKKRVSFADPDNLNGIEKDPTDAHFSSKRVKYSPESPKLLCKHGKRLPHRTTDPSLDPSNQQHKPISAPFRPADGVDPSRLARARDLWQDRKQLPLWAHSLTIRNFLRQNDVLLLSGATGSGKSTQVPQILVTESWCLPKGRIAVTEPRRVAAISLARRVAEEMATPLGFGGKVGYSVRFDSCVGKDARIKFLTEGMLLREILTDPWLNEYEGVVVDEVHERGVGVDLVLGFLKRIVEARGEGRGGRRLKIVIMSATADMERLRTFFGGENEEDIETSNTNGTGNGVSGVSKIHNSVSILEKDAQNHKEITPMNGVNGCNAQSEVLGTVEGIECDDYSDWSGISSSEEDNCGDVSGSSVLSASEHEDAHQTKGKGPSTNGVKINGVKINGVKINGVKVHGIEANGSNGALKELDQVNGTFIHDDKTNGSNGAIKEINQGMELYTNGIKTNGSDGAPKEVNQLNASAIGGCQTNGFHSALIRAKKDPQVEVCHIEGRQYPVKTNYVSEPVQDILEASLKTVYKIHFGESLPGDILVFLTGQESVESLTNLVREYSLGIGPEVPKILALPLFAALPQTAQQAVFQPTPAKTRKVIISTNIAETSITVPGVRFVIDCGKAKVKHFRTSIGLESLLVKPISKSAAIQRQGRAGREAPGECYRLYTEEDYLAFDNSNTPEILRCDLSHPLLTIRARGVEDVLNFPFLDQPPREAMEKALLNLWMLGALSDTGAITSIGSQIARLPLSVSLGRALIAAAEPDANCVTELIDIIACLSVENVFVQLNSDEKREQAETARRELYKREGDHLTFLATVQAYAAEDSDRHAWAERHFVSHRAMRAVMDVRKQLRALCLQMKILSRVTLAIADEASSTLAISSDLSAAILKSFLKGFAMNTAALCPDGSYRTLVGKQTVAIHPSSVLFGRKVEAIVFSEFVFTKRCFARGVSAVQLDWVRDRFPVE